MRIAWRRVRSQWRTVAWMSAVVLGLHALGFGLLIALAAWHHAGAAGALTVGTGITAYTLGPRHAFDADHVAAIDNTTRKLTSEGKRPMSVGVFFSLGQPTLVLLPFLLFAARATTLPGQG